MDESAVHVVTHASLAAGREAHPAGAWEAQRFRPNLVVDVPGTGFVEDGWVGSTVRVGTVRLGIVTRTIRCPMTSMAQPGLDADPHILSTTAELTGKRLGVYADVVVAGAVAVGDHVIFDQELSGAEVSAGER